MARKNKNSKKSTSHKYPTPRPASHWLAALLVVGIVGVSYAVVAANRIPVIDVSAKAGTTERDKQLQSAEIKQEAALHAAYDKRYQETLLLDEQSATDVVKGSFDGSL